MLNSFVNAVKILVLENFRNSFKIRSESQALFNFRFFMLFRTSYSEIVEFNSKLCSEVCAWSICGKESDS